MMLSAAAAIKEEQRTENFLDSDGEGPGEREAKGSKSSPGRRRAGQREQPGQSPPGAIREKQGGKEASVTEAG